MGSVAVIMTRNSTSTYYNRVVALGQGSSATEAQLDRYLRLFGEHRTKVAAVSVGASARPRVLNEWLEQRGLRRGPPTAKLWRDGSRLPSGGGAGDISVRRVKPAEASTWVDVVAQVWRAFGYRRPWFEARAGQPGWTHYVAWIDGQPAAAGALFMGEVAGRTVGHLVDGVTLRPWRRRGAQSAIIRRRVTEGIALGCELFTSETAPPLPRMPLVSFRNLCRQGFSMAYLRDNWKLTLRYEHRT